MSPSPKVLPATVLRRRFGMALAIMARHWRQGLNEGLSHCGLFSMEGPLAGIALTSASWAPLVHLDRAGEPLSQKDLAARVGIDGSSLVRLIDSLVEQNLVERHPDHHDRRIKLIRMTELGRTVVRKVDGEIARMEDEWLSDLDDQTIAVISCAITAIEARLAQGASGDNSEP